MKKQSVLFAVPALIVCLALGLAACSSSDSTETTLAPSVTSGDAAAGTPEGAWYRISAVKADGTPYTDVELAGNPGTIVFGDGTFAEYWPEETYEGSFTYADGAVALTYEDGDIQTLTLADGGSLTYTYEEDGSTWDGETSTYSRVSPIDGTWLLTAGTKADGTAFAAEDLAAKDGSFIFDQGVFGENWAAGETHGGTFVYTQKDGSIVLTYDGGGDSATLTLDAARSKITWRYVSEDPDDEDYVYNGETYYYALTMAK